ncbi:MAG: hypothetical protein AAGI07_03480 [Bacteroidota bacterium]
MDKQRLLSVKVILYIFLSACTSGKTERYATVAKSETLEDAVILLENEKTSLALNLYGGAFTDFHLKAKPINPLSWKLSEEQMPKNNREGAPFRGHFLCLGRWGSPSEGEIAAGVPHNGEQSNSFWTVKENNVPLQIHIFNEAPLDGLTVERKVSISVSETIFKVEEVFENTNSLGRVSNVVQHPTLGPPFLSKQTRIFSNAGKGFLQKFSYPEPEKMAFDWPRVKIEKHNIDVDFSKSDHEYNGVATHIFTIADTVGWIAAFSPEHQLMLAYVWDTGEYPWLNVWHHSDGEKVLAKGLEFGTTGIGRPYKDLLENDTRFFGRNSFEYIDAGEKISKTYYCLLVEVPKNLVGVNSLEIKESKLHINYQTELKTQEISLLLP